MPLVSTRARALVAAALAAAATTLSVSALASPAQAATSASTVKAATAQDQASCAGPVAKGHYRCFAIHRTYHSASATFSALKAKTDQAPLTPANLKSAYSLPGGTAGSGQTVYVVDAFGYPSAAHDLAVYRKHFSLPACTVSDGCLKILNQRGKTTDLPDSSKSWSGETALDLQMVSAVCPKCHITLIQADSAGNDLLTAVKRANTLGAAYVSMSWGGDETTKTSQAALDSAYFKKTGVVYTAASGDDGYDEGVIYPATSSRVVAVGGTRLTKASATTRGWTESAWDLAGSGCSDVETRPAWQTSAMTSCTTRGTTDVSAVADPDTGVAVYQTYGLPSDEQGWQEYGGTSASTPIIAATYAMAGGVKSTDNAPSLLYAHTTHFHDITSGSNGTCGTLLCTAHTGWDGPTGLGTPNGITAFHSAKTTKPKAVISSGWSSATSRNQASSIGTLVLPHG